MASAVVITGMHRSGTSLLASFLERAGVDLGADFFPADPRNPRGYFEDRELLELETAMLHACVTPGEAGLRDWGWTEGERLDRSALPAFRERAAALVAAHARAAEAAGGGIWGFKDPRSSLLLDFWDDLLGGPRYVFVYRSPWEVMRSVARLPVPAFLGRPDAGLRAWAFYNRHLLAFRRAHRDRSLLLPIEVLLADPDAVLDAVRARLGIALPGPGRAALAAVLDPALLAPLGGPPALPALLARLFPEIAGLWRELEDEADLRAGSPAREAEEAAARPAGGSPALSVVLDVLDDGELLPDAIAAVEWAGDCEAVVADGGSTDPYTRVLLERLPEAGVTVVRTAGDLDAVWTKSGVAIVEAEDGATVRAAGGAIVWAAAGAAAVRNAGLRAARGPLAMATGAHLLRPEFAAAAREVFAREPEVGVVYGEAPPPEPREDGRIASLDSVPLDACIAFRREVWEGAGGYDEALAAGYETWGLLLAAAESGWRFRQVPEAACELRAEAGALRRAEPEDPRPFLERLAAAHPLLVDARLPRLLREREVLWLAEMERTRHLERALGASRIESAASRAESAAAGEEITALLVDAARRAGELAEAREEIERWRRRVEFMERTSAWRARDALLRLRRKLGGS